MNSLLYRQERNNQIRQTAIRMKYNYLQSMDDDLWDWNNSSPRARGSYLRNVISRREYSNIVGEKVKKVKKYNKKESSSSISVLNSTATLPAKRIKRTKRSNTTCDSVARIKSPKSSPNINTLHLSKRQNDTNNHHHDSH